MWKKQDDAMGAQPESDSKLESLGDALIESLMDGRLEKRDSAVGPQKVLSEAHPPSSSLPTMTTYTEALNEFTKNATVLIEQLPLLSKARVAYEEAMKASAEIRRVLDAEEHKLRTLMTELEQGLSVHDAKPASDKKSPEPAKVERIGGTAEGARGAIQWP